MRAYTSPALALRSEQDLGYAAKRYPNSALMRKPDFAELV